MLENHEDTESYIILKVHEWPKSFFLEDQLWYVEFAPMYIQLVFYHITSERVLISEKCLIELRYSFRL